MTYGNVGTAAPGLWRGQVPWWSVLLMLIVFYPPVLRPFALLGGEAPWLVDHLTNVAEGSRMRQFQLGLLGLVALRQLVSRRSLQAGGGPANVLGWLLLLFGALMVGSVLWSDEPGLTIRRVGAFSMVVLAAVAYRRMPGEKFLRLVFFTTLAALTFGLAKEVVTGSFQPWDPAYRFKGTLSHANLQGWTCALAILAGISLVHGLRRWRLAMLVLLPVAGLLLTRSRTSLLAVMGAVLVYVFVCQVRRHPLALAAGLFLAAATAICAVWIEQSSPVAEDVFRLGREDSELTTLQGRTEIWREALVFARTRPWLGYGYDAFWSRDRTEEFATRVSWGPSNAHSNYLDILLSLGWIGLTVFVCILGTGVVLACRAALASGGAADFFTVALLAFCVFHSLLETTLVGPLFVTLVFLTSTFRLGFPVGKDSSLGHVSDESRAPVA